MTHISTLTAFGKTTCALLDDHSVRCWADNAFGEPGTADPGTDTWSLNPVPAQFP